MNRFYVPLHTGLKNIWIDSPESHHIVHVKRLKIGDSIIVFNGIGDEFDAEIREIKDSRVKVEIIQQRTISKENRVEIDIAFAIPKGKRSHFLIQKCAELGVNRLIPTHYERSVVKLKDDCSAKIDKWQKIAIESSKQCGRNTVTEIGEVIGFGNLLKASDHYDLHLFACNQADSNSLKNVLQEHPKANKIIICIGPEGGFVLNEMEMAKRAGCKFINLGQQILRVETAAITVSAIISYHYSI